MGGPGEICLPLNIAFAPSTWVALSLSPSLSGLSPARGILILLVAAALPSFAQEQPLLSPVLPPSPPAPPPPSLASVFLYVYGYDIRSRPRIPLSGNGKRFEGKGDRLGRDEWVLL